MKWSLICGVAECLDMFGVAENISLVVISLVIKISLVINCMEKWRVTLCTGNLGMGEIDIR